jgi:hypothetical protein
MGDTEEAVATEYVELHAVDGTPKFDSEGAAFYTTLCGKVINAEALGITDDADAVTCSACKGA